MELKISGKKLGMPARVTAQKTGDSPQGQGALRTRPQRDRLVLSRQVVSLLEQRNRENWQRSQQPEEEKSEDQLLDSLDRELKTMKLCNRIAARIRAGDRVPPEDLRYLMKNDPAGYRLAIAMRKPKKDPKEWESALGEEEKQEVQSDILSSAMAIEGKPGGGVKL